MLHNTQYSIYMNDVLHWSLVMFLASQKTVEKEILKQAREKDVKIHLLLKQLCLNTVPMDSFE